MVEGKLGNSVLDMSLSIKLLVLFFDFSKNILIVVMLTENLRIMLKNNVCLRCKYK